MELFFKRDDHLDIAKLLAAVSEANAAKKGSSSSKTARIATNKEIAASATLQEHASNAMANGELAIATKCYAAAAILNPQNADICIERAGIYYKQRFTGKCILQCQLAIKMASEQTHAATASGNDAEKTRHQVSVVKAREYLAMVRVTNSPPIHFVR